MKSPAFQFYPTDWLGSQRVQMLTMEEEGAYIRLLCFCWQHGSIPANPDQAARLIGKGCSTTLAAVVLAMFQPGPEGRMIHDRLEAERSKQAEWREKSAAGGRKSARMRKAASTTVPSVVQPHHQPNGNSPSPSPSPSPITTTDTNTPDLAAPKAPRARNPLLDELCRSAELTEPLTAQSTIWPKVAKALQIIKSSSREVTPEEIIRRAANYRSHFRNASISSTALASNWGRCEQPADDDRGRALFA